MRRKVQLSLLKKIVGIRALQRAASETQVARTSSLLAERSQELESSESERQADEVHWHEAVHAPRLDPGILSLWTGVVARRDAAVRRASDDVAAATSDRDHSLSDFHAAERRSDVADDMVRGAQREHLRQREQDALQDAADHYLQRRRDT